MMTMIKRFLTALLLGGCILPAGATHLIGGNLGYEYLGETSPGSGMYNYRIYMKFYLNCDNTSNFETLFQLLNQNYNNPIQVGVYTQNPGAPNANKVLFSTVNLFLTDSVLIEPDLPNNCVVGQGLCAKEGSFEGTVTLPLDFNGYHIYSHFFARNLAIDNLANPNGTGIGYYAKISPTPVVNSSPEFLGLPTPFLCVNDTTTYVNSAFDPDGDQLVFSFETPYNSVNIGGGLQPPPSPLPWPVPPVNYNAGYSVPSPFGPGGYAFINAVTGLTEYSSPMQGNYVVVVEIKEYRNNQLIGISRRDVQIQAIICPPNSPAVASDSVGNVLQTSYMVNAGDELCFEMNFNDIGGDSLFLSASGGIFDGSIFNPPATLQSPDSSQGPLSTEFCWQTACDQGQGQPYLFSASVTDNGCPPKTVDIVFDITVVAFAGPQQITGPIQVCDGQLGILYTTDSIPGATYQWSITGGTIIAGGTGPSVTVDWGANGTGTLSVFATNTLQCSSAPVQLSISISSLPNTAAGSDRTICVGDTVVIGGSPTGPPGTIFTWSPPAGLSNPAAANPNAFPSGTTTYIVQANSNGCLNTDTVLVTVNTPPSAGTPASLALCDNAAPVNLFNILNGTPNSGGTWSGPSTLIGGSFDPSTHSGGIYTYLVTGLAPCPNASATVTVMLSAAPDAGADATAPVCASGAPFNMFSLLGGTPDAGGSWFNGLFMPHSATFDPSTDPAGTYYYIVPGTAPCNADTSIVQVSIQVPPADAGPNAALCIGDTVTLNGSGGTMYSWSPPGSLSNANTEDPDAFPTTTTTYTVLVTDAQGCTAIDSVVVTVNMLPTVDAGVDTTICEGSSIQLGGSPTGPAGSTYAWNNTMLLSDTTLANPTADPTQTTTFTVIVTDGNTCVNTDQMVVQVNAAPAVAAGTDESICLNDSVQLQGSGAGTLQWTPPTGLSDANIANPYASPVNTTTYTLTVTDGNNCTNTDQVIVNVLPLPLADAGVDQGLCIGDTLQLNATGGTSYAWTPPTDLSDPAIADPQAFPTSSITYSVLVGDANNCFATDSITITVNQLPSVDAGSDVAICEGDTITIGGAPTGPTGSTFTWSPAPDLIDPNVGNPNALPSSTTVFTVMVSDANSCAGMDSMIVTVNPLPGLNAGVDTALCVGDTVQLQAIGTGNVTWDPTSSLNNGNILDPLAFPTQTTTYTVVLVDGNNCQNTDDVIVVVNSLPTADAGPDAWVCPGFDVQISATGGTGYAWSPAALVDNANIADPFAMPPSTTTFTVTVSDGNGCEDTDEVIVVVNDDVPVDAGPDASLCFGDQVQLGGNPTSVAGTIYLWSPALGLNNDTDPNPIAQPDSTVLYTLLVTNDTCTNVDQVLITIQGEADANFSMVLEPRCDVLRAHFTDLSTGGAQYLWDFGDGTTSTDQEPSHDFPYGSNIVVTLTITDQFGCEGSIIQTFSTTEFDEYVQIVVPNVFTPNGDNVNDTFTLSSNAFLGPCTEMRVFNRWGQRVFISSGNNITWDGRNFAGERCTPGTYFYEIIVNGMAMKGSIDLKL